MSNPISAEKALEIILQSIRPLRTEIVPFRDSFRRVIAEDVVAEEDIPPFDNSAMDGYALQAEDSQGAGTETPVTLTVAGEVSAGILRAERIAPLTAVRIMTGAPIPPGANAVIEQEQVSLSNGKIVLSGPVELGRNIRERGIDIRRGSVVVRKGTRLGAAHMGILASLGRQRVSVYKAPDVALLVTGNELSEDPSAHPASIRNSNSFSLGALVQDSYSAVNDLGVARDDVSDLANRLAQGLRSDVLITSGGVSVGKYDLVLEAWKRVGIRQVFWKVNIKPGMPLAFGEFRTAEHSTLVFGLPGNPVSSYVTFLQFVRPALRAMQGEATPRAPRFSAVLEHDVLKNDGKRHFVRGIARNENGRLVVRTTGSQSSAVLTSLAAANCLIILPEEKRNLRAGDVVDIEFLSI